jgi:cytosine deaminase
MTKKEVPVMQMVSYLPYGRDYMSENNNEKPRIHSSEEMRFFMAAAIDEAKKGLAEGGIPIGSVLVIDDSIVGRGHNRRVQNGSAILHAEMDALENAGRLSASDYRKSILYSTLSPCDMCSGAVLLYGIPVVVIGENQTFMGPEDYVESRGVNVIVLNDEECIRLMNEFIESRPALWNEDIGELD